jgi:hypothetical protein
MLFSVVLELFQNFARYSACYSIGRKAFGYNRIGANDTIIAYANSTQY